ncbi:esterase/lipase family protein [Aquabacterium humicola]|uniref:esterase/lipase family protein n=1 Tax=Aquabacterium humicola TaxID=3237377 RepID=UPI0025429F9A|nr:alpha/beta fold hydrolase [Rubrivivax pictus]
MKTSKISVSDLRGLSRLGVQGVLGLTDVVEAMHHTISSRAGIVGPAPTGRTRGITGGVYRAVRGTTRLVGHAADALLGALPHGGEAELRSPRREAVIAALNGVWGDHLAETANPLALPMRLRSGGRALTLNAASLAASRPPHGRRLLVLVHGLCMNDLQWQRRGHEHGRWLAQALGFTPLHLHYNSGRHVSQNGRDLAALLERLVAGWPVPVDELVLLGHSMGGLVARSACHAAASSSQDWLRSLKALVFLGTPHHGAALERGGRLVDALFGFSPYAAPIGRIGASRSAGITDLRFGNLQDADWQGPTPQGGPQDRRQDRRRDQRRDDRQPTPLPAGVPAYALAGTLAATLPERAPRLRDQLVGDGLVSLASALGDHDDPALALALPAAHRRVLADCSHWDLLDRPEAAEQLRRWLA